VEEAAHPRLLKSESSLPVRMRLGSQRRPNDDTMLSYLARIIHHNKKGP